METLDQLIGADFTLSVIRGFYPSDISFLKGVHGLLSGGDVRLLMLNHEEVPQWRWRELFTAGKALKQLDDLMLQVTEQGAGRVT